MALATHYGGCFFARSIQDLVASLTLGVKSLGEGNGIVPAGSGMAFCAGLSVTAGIIAQLVKIMMAAKAIELIGVAGMRERNDRALQPSRVSIGK